MKKQSKNYSSNEVRSSQSSISNSNSFQRIYEIVRNIPKGKVMTYGQVALLANVATPRVVGFALHANQDPQNIPCHRVIFANGTLSPGYAFGGKDKQQEKLQAEGILFVGQKVDLTRFQAI